MRLITWNLSDLDVTTPKALEDLRVTYLASTGADVLCLQKVSSEFAPERLDKGLSRVGAHLGMSGALSRAAGHRLHVAVLWQSQLRCFDVAERVAGSRRNHLLVDLEVGDRRLRVGSVHLPSSSVGDQLHDLDLLLPLVDSDTVLAGDWNSTGADPSYDARALEGDDRQVAARLDGAGLVDAAVVATADWQPTWRTSDGRNRVRIDAVRLSPVWGQRLSAYRVHTEADRLSLHRPVEITLDVGAG